MNNLDTFYQRASSFEEYAQSYLEYIRNISTRLNSSELAKLNTLILEARQRGSTIFVMGNGGSASAASHYACDLGKNTFVEGKPPIKSISLTDNVATMTALGNDHGYDSIFIDQIKHLLKEADVVIGISASGNSPNVVRALQYANNNGAHSVAIVGFGGGKMKEISELVVEIPSEIGEYGPVEDFHMIINHLLATYLHRHIQTEQ